MDEGAPTTARVRGVLSRAGRVVIAEGPPDEADFADVARIVVTGAGIADLARLLAVVDGGTGDRCRCTGWPTITVHNPAGEPIARWTLHHGSRLRGIGDCDADLRDGPALTEWLAEHGLTGSREVRAELTAQEAEEQRRRRRWLRAAPAGLCDAALAVSEPPGPDREAWSDRLRRAEAGLAALLRHGHPDGTERIRVLLAWAGISAREATGGLKWYDLAVQRQLLAEDPGLVLAALTTDSTTPAQLDGAAQLFASLEWTAARGKDLPEPVSSTLAAHIRSGGTAPMRFRLQHGYYGAGQAT